MASSHCTSTTRRELRWRTRVGTSLPALVAHMEERHCMKAVWSPDDEDWSPDDEDWSPDDEDWSPDDEDWSPDDEVLPDARVSSRGSEEIARGRMHEEARNPSPAAPIIPSALTSVISKNRWANKVRKHRWTKRAHHTHSKRL